MNFQVLESAKSILLQCATPDSLIRLSKSTRTDLAYDAEKLQNQYFIEQHHSDLADLIQQEISNSSDTKDLVFMQVHYEILYNWIRQLFLFWFSE